MKNITTPPSKQSTSIILPVTNKPLLKSSQTDTGLCTSIVNKLDWRKSGFAGLYTSIEIVFVWLFTKIYGVFNVINGSAERLDVKRLRNRPEYHSGYHKWNH